MAIIIKPDFMRPEKIEREANHLLDLYFSSKGKPLELPIPVEDILENYLKLNLEILDMPDEGILGYYDAFNNTIAINAQIIPESAYNGASGRFTAARSVMLCMTVLDLNSRGVDKMSQTKTDPSFHQLMRELSDDDLMSIIAEALRIDYGHLRCMNKEIGNLIGVDFRAIKNWLNRRNLPSVLHFLNLIKISPTLMQFTLTHLGSELLWQFYISINNSHRKVVLPRSNRKKNSSFMVQLISP